MAEVRIRATREGSCYQHVQAIIVAIDQYAEAALGNRQFFFEQASQHRRRQERPSAVKPMCNLYSVTTNQEAIRVLFRVVNRYVGNLAPMPGVLRRQQAINQSGPQGSPGIANNSGNSNLGMWPAIALAAHAISVPIAAF